jgi:hypothetical protein
LGSSIENSGAAPADRTTALSRAPNAVASKVEKGRWLVKS